MKAFTKVVSGAQRSRSNSVPNVLKSVSGPVLNNTRRRLSASPPSLSTIPEKLILAQRRRSISHFACDFVATEQLTAKAALPRKITWLIGAPGSGKGTNSAHVNSIFGYKAPTIVMSSLLETPEFKRIKDSGGMVGDELVFDILLKELAKPQYRHGVVVDGFPRTERQAKMLTDLFENNSANTTFDFVMLHTDEETSVARQLARGEGVKKLNALRKENGLPTVEERATDTCIHTARKRYSTFLEQYGVVEKLSNTFTLHVVDASSSLDVVQQRLTSTLTSTLPTLSKSHLTPLTQAPNLSRLSSPLTASPSPLRNAFHHELLSSELVNSSSSNHRMVFI